MKREELDHLIGTEELLHVLDVKTLIIDMMRQMDSEEILALFWKKLPDLEEETVKRYLYMRRT